MKARMLQKNVAFANVLSTSSMLLLQNMCALIHKSLKKTPAAIYTSQISF